MVQERDFPVERLKVEVYTYPEDAFILGLSRLGFETLGASSGGLSWREIVCDANSLSFRRGGQPNGPSNTLDAGYLAITLVNKGDPMTDPGMLPNVPIRVTGSNSGNPVTSVYGPIYSSDPIAERTFKNRFVADDSTDYIWFRQSPRTLVELTYIKVTDTTNGNVVYSLDASDYANTTAWLSSPEAAKWSFKSGGTTHSSQKPWALGWGSAGGYFFTPVDSTLGDPTTAQRTLTTLVPGREYEIEIVVFINFDEVGFQFGAGEAFSTGVLFTGTLEDIRTKYDKKGNVFATLTAVDGTRELLNTPRYGAVASGGAKNDTFQNRMNSLVASTTLKKVPWGGNVPFREQYYTGAQIVSGTTRWGTSPSGVTPLALAATGSYMNVLDDWVPPQTQIYMLPLQRGIQYTVTGLTVGNTYTVTADLFHGFNKTSDQFKDEYRNYRMAVDDVWGSQVNLTQPYGTVIGDNKVWVSFKATATTANIKIARDYEGSIGGSDNDAVSYRPEQLRVYNLSVWRITYNGDSFRPLQDVNFESSVFAHMQMACDSVGVDFWVNAENQVQTSFAYTQYEPLLHISDVHDENDPLHACFTDIDMSFDTKNTVNVLEVENHGRRNDPEKYGNYLVEDTLTQWSDSHSIELYNARSARIHTSLPDWAIQDRAAQILSSISMPDIRVSKVTIDALALPNFYNLDLFSRVTVKCRGHFGRYRITGIEHVVTQDKWFITITLRKD